MLQTGHTGVGMHHAPGMPGTRLDGMVITLPTLEIVNHSANFYPYEITAGDYPSAL